MTTPRSAGASAPCRGTGLEVIPGPDGPLKVACTCAYCTGRPAIAAHYVQPGFTAAMLDAIPDEDW